MLIKIEIDEEAKFQHAYLYAYGIPIAYTPFLNIELAQQNKYYKKGFTLPKVSHSKRFGLVLRAPYYINLSSNAQMIATPIYIQKQSNALQLKLEQKSDYHNAFFEGTFSKEGSQTIGHTIANLHYSNITGMAYSKLAAQFFKVKNSYKDYFQLYPFLQIITMNYQRVG